MPGTSDPSLAGRTPPAVGTYQLRPAPLNPSDVISARKYSDTQQPYISIYQDFNLPISFQPTRYIPDTTPPRLEKIISVSCKMTKCEVEAPLYFDNPSITEPDEKNPGKAKIRLPKFDPSRLAYYKGSLFFEPKVTGQSSGNFLSVCATEALNLYAGSLPGQTQLYSLKGYFTERNFYDREWIVQWQFLLYKLNSKGVYWNCPLVDQLVGSMVGINKAIWIHSIAWSPNEFFQPDKSLAKRYDGPQTEKYIKGAKKIIQYKPSEIGSLRFYFTFKCTTDFPGASTETFEATMSVKYNTEIGAERLKFAQKSQRDKATSPGGEAETNASTPTEARETQAQMAASPPDDPWMSPKPLTPEQKQEALNSLTLY
jgi:hypothetical protein